METLRQDIRFGFRMLMKNPGFAAVAAISIAVGIGANATVFGWINSVLLNPLQGVARTEEIVTLETVAPSGELIDTSYPDYRDLRDQAQSFDGVIVFKERPLSLDDGQATRRVWALTVSGNYFDVLGVRPALGRFFNREEQEEKPGAPTVAVLGYDLWRTQFQADRAVVGRTIQLNRQPFTVIGVAQEEFHGTIVGLKFDVYVPLVMHPQLTGERTMLESRAWRSLYAFARLKPGTTLDQSRAEVQTIAERLARQYPDSNRGISATLLPVWKATRGAQEALGTMLQILLGVAVLVLLIVCANVANLQLARGAARQRELSIRLALGAGRWRIARQLLTESLLLALAGGAGGVLLAFWMVDLLTVFVPPTDLPIGLRVPMDGQVLGFTAAISIVAGLLFGIAPARQAVRRELTEALKEGERGASGGAGARKLRAALVVGEVALAVITLVSAGLLVRSLHNARQADPGFRPEGVLLVGFDLSTSGYTREQGLAFATQLKQRVESLPGVERVSYAEDVPLGMDGGSWQDLTIDGYVPGPNENMRIYRNLVWPGYFDLMGIGLLEGRDFNDRDDANAPPVAIVTREFARRYFRGESPINRQFRGWGQTLKIVGMVEDIKYRDLDESPKPYFYVPLRQLYRAGIGFGLHVRTTGNPESLLPLVQKEIRAIDSTVLISGAAAMVDFIGAAYFAEKAAALLVSALGAVALFLAALGLYCVMAYSVTQRTHEIGIRLALGAEQRDILGMVLAEGTWLTLVGLAAGLVAAFGVTSLLRSLLLGVGARDPLTYAAAAVALGLVALVACYVPARRASRVDPMAALRYE
jgi:predicted permease